MVEMTRIFISRSPMRRGAGARAASSNAAGEPVAVLEHPPPARPGEVALAAQQERRQPGRTATTDRCPLCAERASPRARTSPASRPSSRAAAGSAYTPNCTCGSTTPRSTVLGLGGSFARPRSTSCGPPRLRRATRPPSPRHPQRRYWPKRSTPRPAAPKSSPPDTSTYRPSPPRGGCRGRGERGGRRVLAVGREGTSMGGG